jgi:hypothetical protein
MRGATRIANARFAHGRVARDPLNLRKSLMTSDYDSIRQENERKYGTDIGRIGHMLLAERYADRTHFIYELLQNAEDAIARRQSRSGSRAVQFDLSHDNLRVSHFGAPFTERDVRGICGIAESTKDGASIGRFGIGFKSVYAYTKRPAIWSGHKEHGERFCIDNFVLPSGIDPLPTKPEEETVIVLPLRGDDHSASSEIAAGLRQLGPRTLLFLREIDTVIWSVDDGPSGVYTRSEPKQLAPNVRRVEVLGEEKGQNADVDETWLIFDRLVLDDGGKPLGRVEIAFLSTSPATGQAAELRPVAKSSLVVFFPTAVETHLGFVVQGPYRTTPSRDNLYYDDSWNEQLVRETALLVADAIRFLRDDGSLDADALLTLPINRAKFQGDSLFAPIFEAVLELMGTEPVLPAYGGGYVDRAHARLARTQELRELFTPEQVADLFQTGAGSAWLSEDITVDKTPDLRRYLLDEVKLQETTPDIVVRRLNASFLSRQSDAWIARLYRFLRGQSALMHQRLLHNLPLVRLQDGTQVPAFRDHQPQAWLPIGVATECPTVRPILCEDNEARAFLQELGLKEPDAIEEVVRVTLPKYQVEGLSEPPETYAQDIERILHAYRSDAIVSRKEHLRAQLRTSRFVVAVDAGSGVCALAKPTDVYSSTMRLKELLAGLDGVLLVDDSLEALRGEQVRDMLEGCGVARHVEPLVFERIVSHGDRAQMRSAEGIHGCTGSERVQDLEMRGLEQLLSVLPTLPLDQARRRAQLLWEELCALLKRRGEDAFAGEYSWQYYTPRVHRFDASFLNRLNETAWISNARDVLARPCDVVFQTIEPAWIESPFLLSKIHFRPPAVDLLAKEAGIDPKMLDFLKHRGLSLADLEKHFPVEGNEPAPPIAEPSMPTATVDSTTPEEQLRRILGEGYQQPSPPSDQPSPPGESTSGGDGSATPGGGTAGHAGDHGVDLGGHRKPTATGGGTAPKKRSPGSEGGRPFVSYVGVHANEVPSEDDPDGLDTARRGALEELAIRHVLASEPALQRTRKNNAGYDLEELNPDGTKRRWIEVKAMTGQWRDRSVGLSRAQFECARLRGVAYWLYVVECAGTKGSENVRPIQDPAGKAKTFTFDHGWLEIAEGDRSADDDHTEEEKEP